MSFNPSLLEEWMRIHYHNAEIDIGSSGVEPWTLGDIREKVRVSVEELDELMLMDSSSYGSEALRIEIANRWGNGNSDSVMVTHGSSEGIYLALNSLLHAGDKVIVLDPCYHSLECIAEEIECEISRWRLNEENNFQPDIEEFRKQMDKSVKMVILNFPHNPTGATLTKQQLFDVIEIVNHFNCYLLWDGAFTDLVYDESSLPDPTIYYDKAISTGTFSKAYGLPGLRFGWCMAAPHILGKFLPLRDRLTLHLSPLIEHLALKVIQNIDILAHERKQNAQANLDYLVQWMKNNEEFIEWIPPGGGVTVFPKIKLEIDVDQLCRDLSEQSNVLLVPGSCFGYEQRVRLGFGSNAQDLVKGLKYLEHHLTNKLEVK